MDDLITARYHITPGDFDELCLAPQRFLAEAIGSTNRVVRRPSFVGWVEPRASPPA